MTDAYVRTRWYNLLYLAFVWSMIALYIGFVVVPYFTSGVYQYSYREVSEQHVPGYPYGMPVAIGAFFAIIFVPWMSVLPGLFMVYNFPCERHLYTPFERRIIGSALIAHLVTLVFMFLTPFGNIMLSWIMD